MSDVFEFLGMQMTIESLVTFLIMCVCIVFVVICIVLFFVKKDSIFKVYYLAIALMMLSAAMIPMNAWISSSPTKINASVTERGEETTDEKPIGNIIIINGEVYQRITDTAFESEAKIT